MSSRFLAIVLVAGLGCSSSTQTPKTTSKPPPAKKVETQEQKPVDTAETTVIEYAYSPVGKRDPFRSILDDQARSDERTGGKTDCGPLCKWELEQLKLVAVISGVSNPLAMVEDPKGSGHVVRRGTFVGKRNGKVTQIRAGEIVVTEIFKDQMGKPHVQPIVIRLPQDKNKSSENLAGAEAAP